MNVPLLDLSARNEQLQADPKAAFARVLRSSRFLLGPEVEEEWFAQLGQQGDCPVASNLAEEAVSGPVYPALTREAQEMVVSGLASHGGAGSIRLGFL